MEIGVPELLIILVIVIVLFGPGRFGKVLGELGTGIRSLKDGLEGTDEKKMVQKSPEIPTESSAENPHVDGK